MVAKSMTCCVDGCKDKVVKRGYCTKHYKRLMRHGDPLKGGVFRGRLDRTKKCSTDGCDENVDIAYLQMCSGCYTRKCRTGSAQRRRVKKGVPLRWLCCLSRGVHECIIFPYGNVQLQDFRQEYPARIVCEMFNGR